MALMQLPWGETAEIPDDWNEEQANQAYQNITMQRVRDNKPDMEMSEFPFEAEYGTPLGAEPGEALHYLAAPFEAIVNKVAAGYVFATQAMQLPEGQVPTEEMMEEERIMSSFGLPDARMMTKQEAELGGRALGEVAAWYGIEGAFKYGPRLAGAVSESIAELFRGPAQWADNAMARITRAKQTSEAAFQAEMVAETVADAIKAKPELAAKVRQTELEAVMRPYNPADEAISHADALDDIQKIHGSKYGEKVEPTIKSADDVLGTVKPYKKQTGVTLGEGTATPPEYVSTQGQRKVAGVVDEPLPKFKKQTNVTLGEGAATPDEPFFRESQYMDLGGEEEFVANMVEENARFVYEGGTPSEYISTRGQRVVEGVSEVEAAEPLVKRTPEQIEDAKRAIIDSLDIIDDLPESHRTSLLETAAETLKSEAGHIEGVNLRDSIKAVKDSAGVQRVAGRLGRIWNAFKEGWLSPDFVAEVVHKDAASLSHIKHAGRYDRGKVTFLVKEFNELKGKVGKILNSPEADFRVGRWLDNVDDIPDEVLRARTLGMSREELEVGQWFKQKYEDLINKWGRNRLVDADGNIIGDIDKVNRYIKEGATAEELAALNGAEKEVYSLYSRKFKDYLPHMMEKDEILAHIEGDLQKFKSVDRTTLDEVDRMRLEKKIVAFEKLQQRVEGGMIPLYDELPRSLRMANFEPRAMNLPHSFSANRAYRAYLTGIARKIYDEPIARNFLMKQSEMLPEARAYMTWFTERYLGMHAEPLGELWQTIRNAEWIRTLGLNPRSAIGNLTQRVNTIAELGHHSVPGQWRALRMRWNPEDMRLWELSGIEAEIPQVLMGPLSQSKWLDKQEKFRRATGFFFTQVERGNRKHTFFSAMEKFKNLPEAEAIQKAIDVVHKTQFQYGRVGMPRALGEGFSSVAFQFWSFPVKQAELMHKWWTGGPKGLASITGFLAMAEGGNKLMRDHLNTDLSNYLGFGLNWGEFYEMAMSASKNEWEGAFRHYNMMVSRGTGILPQGPGPGFSAMLDAFKVTSSNKTISWWAQQHLNPVMYNRLSQAIESAGGEGKVRTLIDDLHKVGKMVTSGDEKHPVFNQQTGERISELTGTEHGMRLVGPRPAREVDLQGEHYSRGLTRQELQTFSRTLADALVRGDMKTYNTILKRVPKEALPLVAFPSDASLEGAMLRRNLPRSLRDYMKTGKFYLYHEMVK